MAAIGGLDVEMVLRAIACESFVCPNRLNSCFALNVGLRSVHLRSSPFRSASLSAKIPVQYRVRASAQEVEVQVQERRGEDPADLAAPAAAVLAQNTDGEGVVAARVMEQDDRYILGTYARAPIVLIKGEGSKLYDADGKEYIDMAGGIAVNALGHGDPLWLQAVVEQAGSLTHVSNLYYTVPQAKLAERLVTSSFGDRVFFCNSGTEANEAAIKFARKYQRAKFEQEGGSQQSWFGLGSPQVPVEFVAFTAGFHGRTMGALALTSKVQYRAPFEPVMPGVTFATYGDLNSAASAIKKGKTAAVFVEPVQGEGGVHAATREFLQGLRQLCDDAGALLVFDEIQCGLGRTGRLFAHDMYGVLPDLMTLAKPLAGGLPIGAVVLREVVAKALKPGDHGSTFAGNPLVCHAALAVLDRLQEPGFLENVTAKGDRLKQGLRTKLGQNPHVKEVRGTGLLVGLQLDVPATALVNAAREKGLLVITAGQGDVVRFAPPLVITNEEIDATVDILAECLPVLG
eukprot:jgi/Mesen1/1711/ME000138S00567